MKILAVADERGWDVRLFEEAAVKLHVSLPGNVYSHDSKWLATAATLLGALDKDAPIGDEIKTMTQFGEAMCHPQCPRMPICRWRQFNGEPGPRCPGPAQPGKKWIMVEVPE